MENLYHTIWLFFEKMLQYKLCTQQIIQLKIKIDVQKQ